MSVTEKIITIPFATKSFYIKWMTAEEVKAELPNVNMGDYPLLEIHYMKDGQSPLVIFLAVPCTIEAAEKAFKAITGEDA